MAVKITDSMRNLKSLAEDDAVRRTVVVAMGTAALVILGIGALPFWLMTALGVHALAWIVYGVWALFYVWRVGQIMSFVLKREPKAETVDEVDPEAIEGVAKRWRL